MRHYIALIHKESGSGYGVSFPDLPGVVTVGDSIDEAIQKAAEVFEFAAEDWTTHTGRDFPKAARSMSCAPILRFATMPAKLSSQLSLCVTKPRPQNRPQASPASERP
ncbi:MAG TPA: type II toxin-antitoxin system HicB family antitoxin [Xanthobacteraceae bacterium]|nr:type II toxin-antitoxin system HicB family antitoxin [Xanthobacteraceae bacterium]